MVSLLTIQILSIIATALTNLIAILAFATDYWSIIVYDLVKLRSHAKWILFEEINSDYVDVINGNNISDNRNETLTHSLSNQYQLTAIVTGFNNNTPLYTIHKGIFRQCNYLSKKARLQLKISQCRLLKSANNQYDDIIHGMNNPGREFIRLHNVAASCAILIVLLLFVCTFVGIAVGILNSVVLATMTIGIIYLVATMFSVFLLAIMQTILKSERKQSHCFSLEILPDEFCAARSIQLSYSFLFGCSLVIFSFITSVLWLSLQEKQRKFAQH